LCYEEGGSNGGNGGECRSTVGLITVSTSTTPPLEPTWANKFNFPPVEVWCVPLVGGNSSAPFIYDTGAVCAALFRPPSLGSKGQAFLPHISVLTWNSSSLVLSVETIVHLEGKSLSKSQVHAQTTIPIPPGFLSKDLPDPNLFMGPSPGALIVCHQDVIVLILRRQGLVYAFLHEKGNLLLLGTKSTERYIVDVTTRPGKEEGEIDIVLLLCNPLNTQDGSIALCQISKFGFML